ncbi:MAG: carboxypeptidase-like regulatory domain-containing protein, partial [Bacteroidota bacterium]
MMNRLPIVLFFLVVVGYSLVAQERGTIVGVVRDAKTMEGLPSVNVKIKGTYYGASSDFEGRFRVANVSPGSYMLEFTIIGFTTVQRTNVIVLNGEETSVTQELSETVLSLGQEVVVVGEKPLFNLEETASRRSVTSDDLKATAVVDVKEIVTQQVGIIQSDNEVHIRGGRSHENAYLLDGISIQDPLAGTGFGLQLSTEAVEEVSVITGGYNAEYGQATSGIVNVSLKEGAQRYRGSFTHKIDKISLPGGLTNSFNADTYEATLSGPEPLSGLLLPALGIDWSSNI